MHSLGHIQPSLPQNKFYITQVGSDLKGISDTLSRLWPPTMWLKVFKPQKAAPSSSSFAFYAEQFSPTFVLTWDSLSKSNGLLKCSEGLKDGSFLTSLLSRAEETSEGLQSPFCLLGFYQWKPSKRHGCPHGKQKSCLLRLKTTPKCCQLEMASFRHGVWEDPSLSFSPLVLADLVGLFTKEVCSSQRLEESLGWHQREFKFLHGYTFQPHMDW